MSADAINEVIRAGLNDHLWTWHKLLAMEQRGDGWGYDGIMRIGFHPQGFFFWA